MRKSETNDEDTMILKLDTCGLKAKSNAKGQLISKCIFGVFNFLQKTNENKSI